MGWIKAGWVRHLRLALCCLLFAGAPARADNNLVMLTWADYIDPALVSEFEQIHQAQLTLVYFETDDARTEMLLDADGAGYDLILVSGEDLALYQRRGWLAVLNPTRMPMLAHIDPRWRDAYATASEYGAAYFWGTLGIAYRGDLLSQPMTSWMQLFRPDPELHQRMVMIDASRDLIGMALKALGHSINSEDPVALEAVEQLLLAQAPAVKAYAYPALTEQSDLVSGSILAATMFSGDAQLLKSYNDKIEFSVPREGCNLWVDYLAISRASTQRELAEAFINFLNDPVRAARNAQQVNFATPNLAAERHLPAAFFKNPIIYPPAAVIARCEAYTPLSAPALKRRNAIMNHVRGAKHSHAPAK